MKTNTLIALSLAIIGHASGMPLHHELAARGTSMLGVKPSDAVSLMQQPSTENIMLNAASVCCSGHFEVTNTDENSYKVHPAIDNGAGLKTTCFYMRGTGNTLILGTDGKIEALDLNAAHSRCQMGQGQVAVTCC